MFAMENFSGCLPNEIWTYIFSFLTFCEQIILSRTCKRLFLVHSKLKERIRLLEQIKLLNFHDWKIFISDFVQKLDDRYQLTHRDQSDKLMFKYFKEYLLANLRIDFVFLHLFFCWRKELFQAKFSYFETINNPSKVREMLTVVAIRI